MAKKQNQDESVESGEQLDLIDVQPENQKKIKTVAKRYRAAQKARISALEKEIEEKELLLGLIREANLKMIDGKIKFSIDGMTITVTPRDELVKVKEAEDSE